MVNKLDPSKFGAFRGEKSSSLSTSDDKADALRPGSSALRRPRRNMGTGRREALGPLSDIVDDRPFDFQKKFLADDFEDPKLPVEDKENAGVTAGNPIASTRKDLEESLLGKAKPTTLRKKSSTQHAEVESKEGDSPENVSPMPLPREPRSQIGSEVANRPVVHRTLSLDVYLPFICRGLHYCFKIDDLKHPLALVFPLIQKKLEGNRLMFPHGPVPPGSLMSSYALVREFTSKALSPGMPLQEAFSSESYVRCALALSHYLLFLGTRVSDTARAACASKVGSISGPRSTVSVSFAAHPGTSVAKTASRRSARPFAQLHSVHSAGCWSFHIQCYTDVSKSTC
jgi:hypothetical protein